MAEGKRSGFWAALAGCAAVLLLVQTGWSGRAAPERGAAAPTLSLDLRVDLGVLQTVVRLAL